jgi:outer membrane protein assembly factor BamB
VLDDLVIVPAGGPRAGRKVSLVAYRKRTGEQAWEGGSCQISYSSPLVATLAGVRQVVIANEESLSGHDPKTGKVFWESPWPAHSNANPNISQPVVVGPDRLLVSKGYGQGAALLRVGANPDGRFAAEVVWRNPAVLKTKFTSAVLRDGHAYGLSDGVLECVDLSDGRRVWKEGRYRHGQILLVGSLLVVMTESGEIVIVEPTPRTANRVVSRFQALEGMSWNNLALSGRYLLVRNAEEAACYELPLVK